MNNAGSPAASTANRPAARQVIRVVLIGNPNTGKSTLFNALSGLHQRIGNYPGVTVEKRTGNYAFEDQTVEIVDLPGTYSLAPRSPDEMLSVNVLLGDPPANQVPDVVVCVVDASNLQRNLYLVSQLLELNLPTVVVLNMMDVSRKLGMSIDIDRLSSALGVPVVATQADRGLGIETLRREINTTVGRFPAHRHDPFTGTWKNRIDRLEQMDGEHQDLNRFLITRMLFDTDGFMIKQMRDRTDVRFQQALDDERVEWIDRDAFAQAESDSRYRWIESRLPEFLSQKNSESRANPDLLDRWLTHPVWGLLAALVVLVLTFQLVFWAAEPASAAIDGLMALMTGWVDQLFMGLGAATEGALYSLIVDGLIAGVGGVLVFLPQIMLLFFLLAVLEDCGYLARLAFLMDGYLSRIGLSGTTVIPLLSSFACAIPGIMATRVIGNERERLITILIAPLMSCSARLPVYTLMIAAFVPAASWYGLGLQGLTMMAMYSVGIVVAIAVAWILKRTMLSSRSSSFVMEFPTYKIPRLRNIARKTYDGGAAFVKDAGTIIVAATIVVWAAAYFPRDTQSLPSGLLDQRDALATRIQRLPADTDETAAVRQQLQTVQNSIDNHLLTHSYLGRAGHWIEPLVQPLGWDWRLGSAAIASFPAREVVVSTMGVLFGMGAEIDENDPSLRTALKNATRGETGEKLFTLPVALSLMVFFALCAQCASTLAVIKRETRSWKWPIFTFVYMTVLAYLGALLVYQTARMLGG